MGRLACSLCAAWASCGGLSSGCRALCLEQAAPYALLRSVVVRRDHRGRGLAKRITGYLLHRAESQGVAAVYLLTETAQDFFAKLGFRRVEREAVPAAVRRTRQFASLCPQSASCMCIDFPRARAAAR